MKKFLIIFILLFSLQQGYSCAAANLVRRRFNLVQGNIAQFPPRILQILDPNQYGLRRRLENDRLRDIKLDEKIAKFEENLKNDQKIYAFVGLSLAVGVSSFVAYNWLYQSSE